jgi:hypothetical protein
MEPKTDEEAEAEFDPERDPSRPLKIQFAVTGYSDRVAGRGGKGAPAPGNDSQKPGGQQS